MGNRTYFRRFAPPIAAALALLTALTASQAVSAPTSAPAAPRRAASDPVTTNPAALGASAGIGGCRAFPTNNYWNADITELAVSKHSAAWLAHMSPDSFLHPDFGKSYGEQPVPYGIPITLVDNSHPTVHVTFQYDDESDDVPYPFGDDTKIEGGRGRPGDKHAVVINTDTCRLYETWNTRIVDGEWYAGSGATWDLHSNKLRPDGWTSADAAGLPIVSGLLRYDEVEVAGEVTHAIRFTTDLSQQAHIWPARHDAGSEPSGTYPPMGARFRLKADFPMTGYRADTLAVLRAMKTYGLVLADNGSPWFFQGTADKRWPSGLLDELKSIPADAFEAVETRPMMVRRNSGATR